jgi:hypothetical protein
LCRHCTRALRAGLQGECDRREGAPRPCPGRATRR